jgi:Iron-containing redox enzyme
MDTSTAGMELVHAQAVVEADGIYERCLGHPALAALTRFNLHLDSRPLTRPELLLFLASMAAFNRHTIGGIAILAGRLSDEILPRLPRTGHEIGACVLDAAVDEYGLRGTVTHVDLARKFAGHLGIPADEIEARGNACRAATELGDVLFSWYRKMPAAFALGVHTASEVTSLEEFSSWHDTFLKFPEYRLSREAAEFEYLRVHSIHEPEHTMSARRCVGRYLDLFPERGRQLQEGVHTYLGLYARMFHELDTLIFGEPPLGPGGARTGTGS